MKEIARISLKTLGWRRKLGLMMVVCAFILMIPAFDEWIGFSQSNPGYKEALVFCGQLLCGVILMAVLHEGLHGIVFWLYTKRVKFGVKFDKVFWVVPYATSPGYKLRRGQLVCVALAPQIATIIMIVASLSLNPSWALPRLLFWMAMFNFAGGALDIYMSIWLFKFKQKILIEDIIDGAVIYEVSA